MFLELLGKFFTKSRTKKIISEFNLDKSFSYSWGMKRSGKYLRNNVKNKKIIFIEDGLIHSFGIKKKKIPLSICYDKHGIYYDCNSENDLKKFVKEKLSKKNISRANNIIELWKKYSISKYNYNFRTSLISLHTINRSNFWRSFIRLRRC